MLPCLEEADALQFELFDDFADEMQNIVLIIDIVVFCPHKHEIDNNVIHIPSQFVVLEIDNYDITHQSHRLLDLLSRHQHPSHEYPALQEDGRFAAETAAGL